VRARTNCVFDSDTGAHHDDSETSIAVSRIAHRELFVWKFESIMLDLSDECTHLDKETGVRAEAHCLIDDLVPKCRPRGG
jgi:hypothetical protein